LVISATGILVGAVSAIFISENYFGLSKAWVLFGGAASVYTLATFYSLSTIRPLRDRLRGGRIIPAIAIVETPVVALWILFSWGVLALPESMSPYLIATLAGAPLMVILIESFDRRALH
jgi:hypothetical protein